MKILYVTDAWHGFRECIFEGKDQANGLPSFNLVLKKLIDEGNSIDFAVMQNRYKECNLNVGVSWLKEEQFKHIEFIEDSFLGKVSSYIRFICKITKLLSNKKYDFVYAHGTTTVLALFPARYFKVPFGQRVYGTFLWDKYLKTKSKLSIIKHFNQYLVYRLKKNFLIVTNDGSRGDLVQKLLCNNEQPYEFYYWVNGVNRNGLEHFNEDSVKEYNLQEPFIFYPARLDKWKRHDRVINVLSILKKRGLRLNCYFAGVIETNCDDYYESLRKKTTDKDLDNQVHFMGNINNSTIFYMHQKALASLALYDVCNFTNVFHEMMAAGAVTIVKSDGVVDEIIDHGVNGYLVYDDDDEVADIIMELVSSKKSEELRSNAVSTSLNYIKSWEERIFAEINLIKKHAKCEKGGEHEQIN